MTTITKAEASRRLRINRPALDRALSRPGAPSPDSRKRYALSELKKFLAPQRETGLDTLRDARIEEVKLRSEKLRRDLDLSAKKTIPRDVIDSFHALLAQRLRSFLYFKLESELPPKIAGCDALTIRKYTRALADEMVTTMQRDVRTWEGAL